MQGSPTRIFKGLTSAELNTLRTGALTRIASGDFTNLSGAAKSSTRKWEMTPQEILFEANYELSVLAGTTPPSVVYQDFSGLRPMPNSVSIP